MRLLIVRHGDPDYSIDSLTATGWKEAEYLTEKMLRVNQECGGIKAFYVSPLGRAKDTAKGTLDALERRAEECEWLKEFSPQVERPDQINPSKTAWDWLPADWTKIPEFYHPTAWKTVPEMVAGNVGEEYDRVCAHFDELLEKHGYKRYDGENGHYYEVMKPSNDTIAFFCHYGLECVLISHLMNVSPMPLWHHFSAAPTSVTSIFTEERREGIASFRVNEFGDISHLYAHHQKPSFSARFCECFTNDERHDEYIPGN